MNRYYELKVLTKGYGGLQVHNLLTLAFGWHEKSVFKLEETVGFIGYGRLPAGIKEHEAHREIYRALKRLNPDGKIMTQWTRPKTLPSRLYGDISDFQDDLEHS